MIRFLNVNTNKRYGFNHGFIVVRSWISFRCDSIADFIPGFDCDSHDSTRIITKHGFNGLPKMSSIKLRPKAIGDRRRCSKLPGPPMLGVTPFPLHGLLLAPNQMAPNPRTMPQELAEGGLPKSCFWIWGSAFYEPSSTRIGLEQVAALGSGTSRAAAIWAAARHNFWEVP